MPFMPDDDDVEDLLDEEREKIEDEQREDIERDDNERRANKPTKPAPRLLALPPELPPLPLKSQTPKERRAEAARAKRKRDTERKAQIKAVVSSTTAAEAADAAKTKAALVKREAEKKKRETSMSRGRAMTNAPTGLGELKTGWGYEKSEEAGDCPDKISLIDDAGQLKEAKGVRVKPDGTEPEGPGRRFAVKNIESPKETEKGKELARQGRAAHERLKEEQRQAQLEQSRREGLTPESKGKAAQDLEAEADKLLGTA